MNNQRTSYDHDVFISYSSRQAREAYLVRDVLSANGLSCWMAPESIPAGSDYTAEIPQAIAGCKAVVLMLSDEAQHSDYVRSEVKSAVRSGKVIIPFAIRNCKIDEAFDFLISRCQRINAYKGLSDALEELVTTVYAVVDRSMPAMDNSYLKQRLRRFRKRRIVMILAAVLACAVLFAALTPAFVKMISSQRERAFASHGTVGDCTWSYDSDSQTLTIAGEGATDEKSGSYVSQSPWQEHLSSIETLVVEEGVTTLRIGLMSGAQNLRKVSLPASLRVIGSSAFYHCASLREITLNDGLQKLGSGAFSGCTALTTLTIPDSVEEIGNTAFLGSGIATIRVGEHNAKYLSADNCLYNKKMTELICVPANLAADSFTVPDTVAVIHASAMNGCQNLRKIILPDSVTKIGDSAFTGCRNLEEIRLSDHLVSIGKEAFYLCSSLKEITMSDSVLTLGERCFTDCSALVNAVLSPHIAELPKGVFRACSALREMTVPEGIAFISTEAFRGCSRLERLHLPSSVTRIDDGAFMDCDALTVVGSASSYAASYAAEAGIPFEAE